VVVVDMGMGMVITTTAETCSFVVVEGDDDYVNFVVFPYTTIDGHLDVVEQQVMWSDHHQCTATSGGGRYSIF
jgi:hypothetical protein